jgi:hypothetical protein
MIIFQFFCLHRAEIEMYKELEPATRLVILKAICDIRVEVRAHFYCHLTETMKFATFQPFLMCFTVDNCNHSWYSLISYVSHVCLLSHIIGVDQS